MSDLGMAFGVRGGVGFWSPLLRLLVTLLLKLLVGEFVEDGFSLSWGFEVFSIDGSVPKTTERARERERGAELEG